MSIRKGDTFRNDESQMVIKILDFLPSGKIQIEYTRNGGTAIEQIQPAQIKNLLNPELYKRD